VLSFRKRTTADQVVESAGSLIGNRCTATPKVGQERTLEACRLGDVCNVMVDAVIYDSTCQDSPGLTISSTVTEVSSAAEALRWSGLWRPTALAVRAGVCSRRRGRPWKRRPASGRRSFG
jgi:hypothetical protein